MNEIGRGSVWRRGVKGVGWSYQGWINRCRKRGTSHHPKSHPRFAKMPRTWSKVTAESTVTEEEGATVGGGGAVES